MSVKGVAAALALGALLMLGGCGAEETASAEKTPDTSRAETGETTATVQTEQEKAATRETGEE